MNFNHTYYFHLLLFQLVFEFFKKMSIFIWNYSNGCFPNDDMIIFSVLREKSINYITIEKSFQSLNIRKWLLLIPRIKIDPNSKCSCRDKKSRKSLLTFLKFLQNKISMEKNIKLNIPRLLNIRICLFSYINFYVFIDE